MFPLQVNDTSERKLTGDSSLSLYKRKEAVGNDSLFRTTGSGTHRARTELRIDNSNKGETMDTLLIVLLVVLLLDGGGWGYSRWR